MKRASQVAGLIAVVTLVAPKLGAAAAAAGDAAGTGGEGTSIELTVSAPSEAVRLAFLSPLMTFVDDKKICEITYRHAGNEVDNDWGVPQQGPKGSKQKSSKDKDRATKILKEPMPGYNDVYPDGRTNRLFYHCDRLTSQESADVFAAIGKGTLQASLINKGPRPLRVMTDALPISLSPLSCSRQLCYNGTYAYVSSRLSCTCP
jgi:hypothetical protein